MAPAPREAGRREGDRAVVAPQAGRAPLAFLGVAASLGPCLGLFGTVWGMVRAFRAVGSDGAASLSIVAPAIGDALVATACGLAGAGGVFLAYRGFGWGRGDRHGG
ncbi:MAG: hypothetical protein DMD79_26405 [Candidatus Rokuibacteriota bacterium]|nr:MAG: hypothetical protein DMD79_26405 [Candidatus Rokubacteria bacterium]